MKRLKYFLATSILLLSSSLSALECSSEQNDHSLAYRGDECNTGSYCCEQFFGDWCFAFAVELGYKKFTHIPSFAYGTFGFDLDDEPFFVGDFVHVNDRPWAPYGEAAIAFKFPSCCLPCWLDCLELDLRGSIWVFTDTESDQFVDVVPAGGAIFLPFIDGGLPMTALPVPGSIVNTTLTRRYTYSNIDVYLRTCYDFCCGCFSLDLEPFIGFSYNKFNQRFGFDLFAPVGFAAAETTVGFHENLFTNYYDFGGGLNVLFPFCCNFLLTADAGIYGSYARSVLKGKQYRIVGTAPVSTFRSVEDHANQLSYKFKGGGSLNYRCCDFLLGIVAKYEYWNYAAQIHNPQVIATTAIANPAEIVRDRITNYTIEGRIAYFY